MIRPQSCTCRCAEVDGDGDSRAAVRAGRREGPRGSRCMPAGTRAGGCAGRGGGGGGGAVEAAESRLQRCEVREAWRWGQGCGKRPANWQCALQDATTPLLARRITCQGDS